MPAIVVSYVDKPEGHAALRAAATEATLRSLGLVVISSQRDSGAVHTLPAELAAHLGEVGVSYEVREPDLDVEPADDLISAAEELQAELIVIGLRRRSPVGKLMLGANAQRVLLDASCPVLTVKAELD